MSSMVWPGLDRLQGASPDELAAALRQADMIRRKIEVLTAEILGLADRAGAYTHDGHRNVRAWAKATCNWSLAHANVVKQTARVLHGSEIVRDAAVAAGWVSISCTPLLAGMRTGGRGSGSSRAPQTWSSKPRSCRWATSVSSLAVGRPTRTRTGQRAPTSAPTSIVTPMSVSSDHRSSSMRMVGLVSGWNWWRSSTASATSSSPRTGTVDERATARTWTRREWPAPMRNAGSMRWWPSSKRLPDRGQSTSTSRWSTSSSTTTATTTTWRKLPDYRPNLWTRARSCSAGVRPSMANRWPAPTWSLRHWPVTYAASCSTVRAPSLTSVADRRLFTGNLRDVIGLTDRSCMWPGCGLPARACQGDHVQPWAAGGTTSSANVGPACGHHNRFKQRHGYRTWRDPDGMWHVARSDGTEIAWKANAPPGAIAGN